MEDAVLGVLGTAQLEGAEPTRPTVASVAAAVAAQRRITMTVTVACPTGSNAQFPELSPQSGCTAARFQRRHWSVLSGPGEFADGKDAGDPRLRTARAGSSQAA